MSDYDYRDQGGGARERLGRIEERATEAAENSKAARAEIAALAREVSSLTATVAQISAQQQAHFVDDRGHFDTLTARLTAVETATAAGRSIHNANRWWITALVGAGSAVAGIFAALKTTGH